MRQRAWCVFDRATAAAEGIGLMKARIGMAAMRVLRCSGRGRRSARMSPIHAPHPFVVSQPALSTVEGNHTVRSVYRSFDRLRMNGKQA